MVVAELALAKVNPRSKLARMRPKNVSSIGTSSTTWSVRNT